MKLSTGAMVFAMLLVPIVLHFMFLDQIAIMFILIPIFKPIITLYGIDPIWFWTMFLVVETVCAIWPPFGYTLFAMKTAVPDVPMSIIFNASWPFVWLICLEHSHHVAVSRSSDIPARVDGALMLAAVGCRSTRLFENAEVRPMTTNSKPAVPAISKSMISGNYLRDAWYVAAWCDDLAEGQLLAREIMNEPIVLLSKADECGGAVGPLSASLCSIAYGKIVKGASGFSVPITAWNLMARAPASTILTAPTIFRLARRRSYATIEKHRAIWIWMGDKNPDYAKVPDFSVLDNAPRIYETKRDRITIKAHYELIVDNLLDLSHVPFLHDGILGNQGILSMLGNHLRTGWQRRHRPSRGQECVAARSVRDLPCRRRTSASTSSASFGGWRQAIFGCSPGSPCPGSRTTWAPDFTLSTC